MRSSWAWGALGLLAWGCSPRGSSSADATSYAGDARAATPSSAGTDGGSLAEQGPGADARAATGNDSAAGSGQGSGPPSLVAGGAAASAAPPAVPAAAPAAAAPAPAAAAGPGQEPSGAVAPASALDAVLVFTRTTGFRHDSIASGIEAMQRLGQQHGFCVENTEDPADFNDQNLARYAVVIWLNTDSEVLNDGARRAFERYIRSGGGWVGIHAAAASEYGWSWYGQLLGAYFLGHPPVQSARVVVESPDHPSTAQLPQSFTMQDEWYSFRTNPRAATQVLLTLDESSYGVGDLAMGDHPIAWHHEFDGGRAWYTALGHPIEAYTNPLFLQHVLGGIRWAAGTAPRPRASARCTG